MLISIILVFVFMVTAYLYAIRHFNYWKDRGIFYMKPTPFVGNMGPIFKQKSSIGEFLRDIYAKFTDQPYVGIFLADSPCLLIRDFDLAGRILKQDFEYFNTRVFKISKETDHIGAISLFSIHGNEWKNTRSRLSPIFTAKKLRAVFDSIVGVSKKLENVMRKGPSIEMKSFSTCITSDVLSDAVFGFDGEAMAQPENDFVKKLGNEIFSHRISQGYRNCMTFLKPENMIAMGISLFTEKAYNLMRDVVGKSLAVRAVTPPRGDFIDALVSLQSKGPWEGNDGEMIVPDSEMLAGQLFMFFTAGFETSASGIAFCMYELAKNPEIQEKVRQEIGRALEKRKGVFDYEMTNELKYTNKVIAECLRKHPPFPFVDRVCTKEYVIPGTNDVIEVGTKVMLPMMGLHNDEKYFENPDEIIPERFDDVNISKVPYFPFSTGPRTCLGMRFAQLTLRVMIVNTLRNFRLTLNEKTPLKLRMNPKRFGSAPLDNLLIDIEAINE